MNKRRKKEALEQLKCNTEEFMEKVKKGKVPELQEWCKKFDIPKAGNRTELQEKLLNIFQ